MQNTIQHTAFDVEKVRADFPILKVLVNNKPLVYFDNGATAQKPTQVIDAIAKYYYEENSNIHRGVHTLSQKATIHYELARTTVQKHINAVDINEIIFTRGTTESVNLVAHCFGKLFIAKGDEIVVSEMEHHSNILPWQILCEEKGAVLKVIPIKENGELDLEVYKKLLSAKTKLIAVTHVSNTLGVVNDVKEIIAIAKQKNIPVFLDGAQAVPHMAVNVQDLGCDFYRFSGHKIYAPTGIGVLYAKAKWIEKFEPYQTGGGTIKTVSFEKTVYADGPLKFEAGTPNIEGAIGLAVALNYLNEIGLDTIAAYENELMLYATEKLKQLPSIRIYGDVKHKAAVISFNVNNVHP